MSVAMETRAKGRLIFSRGVQNISKKKKKKFFYFGSGLSQNGRRSLRIATWICGKTWILTVASVRSLTV